MGTYEGCGDPDCRICAPIRRSVITWGELREISDRSRKAVAEAQRKAREIREARPARKGEEG